MFLSFQGRDCRQKGAKLYETAVRQSRRPVFYAELGVPDTLDGRFDTLCLHVYLVVDRLCRAGRPGRQMAQAVFNQMFLDMERAVREMGIGDLSVPKHVRRMMKAFNGRRIAYEKSMGGQGLEETLARNIYGGMRMDPAALRALAAYVRQAHASLAAQADEALLRGTAAFPGEYDDRKKAAGAA